MLSVSEVVVRLLGVCVFIVFCTQCYSEESKAMTREERIRLRFVGLKVFFYRE
jgi:hypothetical protein